jgi:hypothetical protein
MDQDNRTLVPWRMTSLAIATSIAIICDTAAVALSEMGRWPGFTGSELVVSALAGGAVLWFYHRRNLAMILFVFVPLTIALLFIGSFAVGILMGRFEP